MALTWRSMTGFGRAARGAVGAEVRSLNHRGKDLLVRLPSLASALEPAVRRLAEGAVARGRVEISVSLYGWLPRVRVAPNVPAARAYAGALRTLGRSLGLGASQQAAWLELMASRPEILVSVEVPPSPAELGARILPVVRSALSACVAMRMREGAALHRDLSRRTAAFERILGEVERRVPRELSAHRSRLAAREGEPLGAGKTDVTEELIRLRAHRVELRKLLAQAPPVGRTLDFLLQEMQREVHTLGSKVPGAWMPSRVIRLREILEQMREQSQNVE